MIKKWMLTVDHLNLDVKPKQQCSTEGKMGLHDSGNSQNAALVSSDLLVLGSPLGDS